MPISESSVPRERALLSTPSREVQSGAPKRIIMIRHTEANHNIGNWLKGQEDTPLTKNGVQQAKEMAQFLEQEPFVMVVTSDLQRAHHTGEIIRRRKGNTDTRKVPLFTTFLARERHYGELEELRMTPDEFFNSYYLTALKKKLLVTPQDQDAHIELVPGWETDAQLAQRIEMVVDAMEKMLLPGQTAVLVCHAHAMRAWLEEVAGFACNGSGSIPHKSGVVIEAKGKERKVVRTFGGIEQRKDSDKTNEDATLSILSKYMRRRAS